MFLFLTLLALSAGRWTGDISRLDGAGGRGTIYAGYPAIVYRPRPFSTDRLAWRLASHSEGSSWFPDVTIPVAYLGSMSIAEISGRPALALREVIPGTFTDAGITIIRANDANGTSWPNSSLLIDNTIVPTDLELISRSGPSNLPALCACNRDGIYWYLASTPTGTGAWAKETAVAFPSRSSYLTSCSCATTPSGRPIIAFTDGGGGLRYISSPNADGIGGAWGSIASSTRITSISDTVSLIFVEFTGDRPVVGFLKTALGNGVYFASASNSSGTTWTTVQISPRAGIGALNLDSSGNPAALFWDSSSMWFRTALDPAAASLLPTVFIETTGGLSTSNTMPTLSFTTGGRPFVVYSSSNVNGYSINDTQLSSSTGTAATTSTPTAIVPTSSPLLSSNAPSIITNVVLLAILALLA